MLKKCSRDRIPVSPVTSFGKGDGSAASAAEPQIGARARILGRLAARFVVFWSSQLQIEKVGWDRVAALESGPRPVLYLIWHGSQLVPLACFRNRGITIMTSLSQDGEIQTQSMHCLGYRTVRGSSSRGGARALLTMVRTMKEGRSASMTVDGPRGPYHQAKPGAVALAQKAAAVIVPVSMGYRHHHSLHNWDRFEIPIPFSRVCMVCGAPFVIPPEMPVEDGCRMIERHLAAGDALAAGRAAA